MWDPVLFSDTDDLLLSQQRLFLKTLLVLAINIHPENTALCCCYGHVAQPPQVLFLLYLSIAMASCLPATTLVLFLCHSNAGISQRKVLRFL